MEERENTLRILIRNESEDGKLGMNAMQGFGRGVSVCGL